MGFYPNIHVVKPEAIQMYPFINQKNKQSLGMQIVSAGLL
jgi:hypothetical protein